jgi:PBSX family phage terminase large subunit
VSFDPNEISPKALRSFQESDAEINIWEGSVSSSKTFISILRWLKEIQNGPQDGPLAMIGKTLDALKRNVISPMQELIGPDCQYYPGRREIELWGRTIFTYGANDERAEGKIRGSTLAGAYVDELTLIPESFWNMLQSRLRVKGAKAFATTNPDGPGHWVKKTWLDRKHELNLKSWAFRLEDNQWLVKNNPGYIESLKKRYVGLWYKRFIDGLWCLAEGAVHDYFDELLHTILRPPPALSYFVAMDYGTVNPTAILLFGENLSTKPRSWVEREFYWDPAVTNRQKTDAEISRDLREFLGPIEPEAIYVDPSAASLKLQLQKDGFYQIQDADNSVLDGIRTVSMLTVSGEHAICRAARQTIEDKSNYVWNTKLAVKTGEDKPIKQHDHTQDAERYGLHTRYGQYRIDYNLLARN